MRKQKGGVSGAAGLQLIPLSSNRKTTDFLAIMMQNVLRGLYVSWNQLIDELELWKIKREISNVLDKLNEKPED